MTCKVNYQTKRNHFKILAFQNKDKIQRNNIRHKISFCRPFTKHFTHLQTYRGYHGNYGNQSKQLLTGRPHPWQRLVGNTCLHPQGALRVGEPGQPNRVYATNTLSPAVGTRTPPIGAHRSTLLVEFSSRGSKLDYIMYHSD